MAKRSVLTQPTESEKGHSTIWLRWMRYFFTEDVSPDNYPLIELQRKAVWVGLAIILQSLNDIDHDWYLPYLGSVGSLIPFTLIGGSFVAMAMAIRPASKKQKILQTRPHGWQRFTLLGIMVLALIGIAPLVYSISINFMQPQFPNDGTSLDTNAAVLLLQGHNPYTDSNVLDLSSRFNIQPAWTTPLQLGQFAHQSYYPPQAEFEKVFNADLKTGTATEFESKVSYPALSFLTLVPFVLFKDYNVSIFYLLSYLILVAVAWKLARPEIRPWVFVLALANIPMWDSVGNSNLDIFCILLLALAWLCRDRRWASSLFFGLALASKQTAWFLAPFYIILVIRNYGLKEAAYRLAVSGGIALAFNLPFILWNPHAWLVGILAPLVDPMFPLGVGTVGLSSTLLLPLLPKLAYTAMESVAMIASLAWYWRICKKFPEAALFLGVMPLFFAWRSLPSYFYCAAFPFFVLTVAKLQARKAQANKPDDEKMSVKEKPHNPSEELLTSLHERTRPHVPALSSLYASSFSFMGHAHRYTGHLYP